ncbi:DUF2938 domain-containing protein [Halopseudomonas pachastrellae]|uniref:DUF2938 domain-containing protein n=1 Tax=Halopseudomonas pachastrellae TaxID=254161 RepID=UPI003D7D5647
MNELWSAVIIGIGATLVMDAWGVVRKKLLGIPPADYALVGRWLGHMAHGRFRHERIAAASPVPAERLLGWGAHYLIGVVFALLLVAMCGAEWVRQPTVWPALAWGIVTVAAPFLLMQPGMGAGVAASRTPRPNVARLQSLITHAVFGVGLYGSALVLNVVKGV